MKENNKKILFTVLGVVLLILVGVVKSIIYILKYGSAEFSET